MKYLVYSVLWAMMIWMTGCSSTPQSPQSKSSLLRINLPEEPVTMDPRKGGDSYSAVLHWLLFDGLTRVTPRSSGDYGIADKIDLSPDKLTYTFHLRDALWSDHTPITAYDFEYSWKSVLHPSFPAPNANLLYPILNAEEARKGLVSMDEVGVKALDDKTLVVTLKSPTPYFLNLTSFSTFFPVCKHVVEKHPEWADHASPLFVCSGPYVLTRWKHEDEFLVDKNPLYCDLDEVSIDQIHISLIKDENTVLELFNRGELDILGTPFTNISVDAAEALRGQNRLQSSPAGKTLICAFNVNHPILANRNIRKALSEAIDREGVIASIGVLDEIPALNFIPPVLKQGKNIPLIKPMDLESARMHLTQGLEELGLCLEDLNSLTMIYPSQDRARQLAQALQEMWMKHLGIKIKIEAITYKEFLTVTASGKFDLCNYYWLAQYDDPMNILDRFRKKSNPKNYPNWENEEYIRLLDASALVTGEERNRIIQQAEELIMDEMPLAPIIHTSIIRMVQPYVKNMHTCAIGSTELHKIRIEKEERFLR